MDGPVLSWRERQILDGIEERLRADTELERRLSTMRLGRGRAVLLFLRSARGALGLAFLASAAFLAVVAVPARSVTAVVVCVLALLVAAAGVLVPWPALPRLRRGLAGRPRGWGKAA